MLRHLRSIGTWLLWRIDLWVLWFGMRNFSACFPSWIAPTFALRLSLDTRHDERYFSWVNFFWSTKNIPRALQYWWSEIGVWNFGGERGTWRASNTRKSDRTNWCCFTGWRCYQLACSSSFKVWWSVSKIDTILWRDWWLWCRVGSHRYTRSTGWGCSEPGLSSSLEVRWNACKVGALFCSDWPPWGEGVNWSTQSAFSRLGFSWNDGDWSLPVFLISWPTLSVGWRCLRLAFSLGSCDIYAISWSSKSLPTERMEVSSFFA